MSEEKIIALQGFKHEMLKEAGRWDQFARGLTEGAAINIEKGVQKAVSSKAIKALTSKGDDLVNDASKILTGGKNKVEGMRAVFNRTTGTAGKVGRHLGEHKNKYIVGGAATGGLALGSQL